MASTKTPAPKTWREFWAGLDLVGKVLAVFFGLIACMWIVLGVGAWINSMIHYDSCQTVRLSTGGSFESCTDSETGEGYIR